MRRIPLLTLAPALIAVLAIGRPASADFIVEFDQPNYNVLPGQTVDVSIFFTATDANDAQLLNDFGLTVALTLVEFISQNATPVDTGDPAVVQDAGDVVFNPGFDFTGAIVVDPPVNDTPGEVELPLASIIDRATTTTGSVFLATLTFTAGTTMGEVTDLSLSALVPGDSYGTLDGNDDPIQFDDRTSFGNATITVLIPEPSSAILTGLGLTAGVAVLGLRRRRRAAAR